MNDPLGPHEVVPLGPYILSGSSIMIWHPLEVKMLCWLYERSYWVRGCEPVNKQVAPNLKGENWSVTARLRIQARLTCKGNFRLR